MPVTNEQLERLLSELGRSPGDADLRQSLGKAYIDAHDYAAAHSAFARAIQLNPKDPWNYLYAGNASYSLGDFAKALRHFQDARDLAPQLAIVWVTMADCHAALGQYATALSCYETAVKVEPTDETALKNLARFKRWRQSEA